MQFHVAIGVEKDTILETFANFIDHCSIHKRRQQKLTKEDKNFKVLILAEHDEHGIDKHTLDDFTISLQSERGLN